MRSLHESRAATRSSIHAACGHRGNELPDRAAVVEVFPRVARYSQITNEALVVGYREGNRLIITLSYSGVPRHSERHQIEFCMFAVLRLCRVLTGQNLVPHRLTSAKTP